MLCLDTKLASAVMRGGRPDVEERMKVAFLRHGRLSLSSIVLMELTYGVCKSQDPAKARRALDGFMAMPFEVLPVTEVDAARAGAIRADLSRQGLAIGGFDVLIAAQALVRDLTLVTNNVRAFARIEGLFVEDWLTPAP